MTPQEVKNLNRCYEALTGYKVSLNMGTEYTWCVWCNYPDAGRFGLEELATVVRYLKANQKPKGPYTPNSMRFSRLIGQPDLFEELLSLAKLERKAARRESPVQKPDKPLSQETQKERTKLGNMLGDWSKKNL
jgi:hypothetical protein